MRPAVRNIILNAPAPIIPASVRPATLAWWDGQKRGAVWAGLPNLATNGSFEADAADWLFAGNAAPSVSTDVAANGAKSVKSVTSAESSIARREITATNGNKIFVSALFYLSAYTGGATASELYDYNSYNNGVYTNLNASLLNQWQRVSAIKTAASGGVRVVIGATSTPTRTLYWDAVTIIDLTAIFGAGNEPTAAEMDAILASEPSYWDGTRTVLANPASKYYWQDYSGNNRHLKLNNMAYTAASGWQGDSLVTDGVDDYGIRTDTWSAANQSFTTMAVFKLPDLLATKYLAYGTSDTSNAFILYTSTSNILVRANDSASGYTEASSAITSQVWHFAVATYDQSDKKTRLYVDGSLVSTSDAISNGLRQVTHFKVGISAGNTAYSASTIRALAAFNRALSGAEVMQIYNNNKRRWGVS